MSGMEAFRGKYEQQLKNAKRRGIGFELTFSEWLEVWGERLAERGHKVMMARYGDKGPYAKGNVYIATAKQNRTEANIRKPGTPQKHGNRWRVTVQGTRYSFSTKEEALAARQ